MNQSVPEPISVRAVLGIVSMILGVLLLAQNLNPVVSIAFLGFASVPLPLSLAMLGSFMIGAIAAGLWNQLSAWIDSRNNQSQPRSKPNNSLGTGESEEDTNDYDEDDDVIEVEYLDR